VRIGRGSRGSRGRKSPIKTAGDKVLVRYGVWVDGSMGEWGDKIYFLIFNLKSKI